MDKAVGCPERLFTDQGPIGMRKMTPDELAMSEQIANLARSAFAPLYWHHPNTPWPRTLRGGSCFFLRFGDRTFGVTAAHVMQALQGTIAEAPDLIVQIRTGVFAADASLIDIDADLDLATFRVANSFPESVGQIALSCSAADWPPPTPTDGGPIVVLGYPESQRFTKAPREADFYAYGGINFIESVGDRTILMTYDPSQVVAGQGAPKPPLHFNMSGCSGGLGMIVVRRRGITRWFPAGVIITGDGGESSGALGDIDLIQLRRISFIRADGIISRN
jgi:hypothetical protein